MQPAKCGGLFGFGYSRIIWSFVFFKTSVHVTQRERASLERTIWI
jgi:hypothetical protein